jgi:hypothetical protein
MARHATATGYVGAFYYAEATRSSLENLPASGAIDRHSWTVIRGYAWLDLGRCRVDAG